MTLWQRYRRWKATRAVDRQWEAIREAQRRLSDRFQPVAEVFSDEPPDAFGICVAGDAPPATSWAMKEFMRMKGRQ